MIRSADRAFVLGVRVRGQVRHTTFAPRGGETRQAFELRRARVVFAGHAFSDANFFKMELGLSPGDLGVADNLSDDPEERQPRRGALLDLYFEFRQLRDLTVRVGQYKLPSNRQRVISSGDLQLVDRSIVNPEFTLDRDVAIDLRSRNLFGLDLFKYYLGVAIARGRDSRGFDDFGMMYFARVEVLPFGLFKDYAEVDLERSSELRASIAGAYAFVDNSRGLRRPAEMIPAEGGTTDNHYVYGDAIVKWSGLSVLTEVAYRRGERNVMPAPGSDPSTVTLPRNGWGATLQAGYLFGLAPLEVAARYSFIRPLGETSIGRREELGGGVSWYLHGHPYKLQADVFRIWERRIADGDVTVRVQLQASL